MNTSIADLEVGEQGLICNISLDSIPLKLLEMGCLPGKKVELIQKAPLQDPLYIKVDGNHLAIRVETAAMISIERIENTVVQ